MALVYAQHVDQDGTKTGCFRAPNVRCYGIANVQRLVGLDPQTLAGHTEYPPVRLSYSYDRAVQHAAELPAETDVPEHLFQVAAPIADDTQLVPLIPQPSHDRTSRGIDEPLGTRCRYDSLDRLDECSEISSDAACPQRRTIYFEPLGRGRPSVGPPVLRKTLAQSAGAGEGGSIVRERDPRALTEPGEALPFPRPLVHKRVCGVEEDGSDGHASNSDIPQSKDDHFPGPSAEARRLRTGLLTMTDLGPRSAFGRLWIGESFSAMGNQISLLAVPSIAILTLNATIFEVGLLQAAQHAPMIVFGLLAGAAADRWSRRRIMIVANVGRSIILIAITTMVAAGVLTAPLLVTLVLTLGSATAFFLVAYQAYLPELVGPSALVRANARLQLSASLAVILGPVLGGFAISAVGGANALAFTALALGVSAVAVATTGSRTPIGPPINGSFGQDVLEGVGVVLHHPVLRRSIAHGALQNLAAYAGFAVLLVFLYRDVGLTPAVVGFAYGLGSVGWVVGVLLAPRLAARFELGTTLAVASTGVGAALLMLPLAEAAAPVAIVVVAQLIFSAAWPVYVISESSVRQLVTADRVLGRVTALTRMLNSASIVVASVLGAWLASNVGAPATLAAAGALALASSLLVLRLRADPVADRSTALHPAG